MVSGGALRSGRLGSPAVGDVKDYLFTLSLPFRSRPLEALGNRDNLRGGCWFMIISHLTFRKWASVGL